MKPGIKTILFFLLTVYIIPGVFLLILDRHLLWYYLLATSSTTIPYFFWTAGKKRSCKFFGIEFRF